MEDLICSGCGAKLQTEDENLEGYVDPRALNRDFILCKRCFTLQHYGKFSEAKVAKDPIKLINQNAKITDNIFLIVDAALVVTPLISKLNELKDAINACQ